MANKFNSQLFFNEFNNNFQRIKVVVIELLHHFHLKQLLILALPLVILFFFSFGGVHRLNRKVSRIYYTPVKKTHISNKSGRILSKEGLTLVSFDTPSYTLRLDCHQMQQHFDNINEVIHTLSIGISNILMDINSDELERKIKSGIQRDHRYLLLADHISERQKDDLLYIPYFKLNKNVSGIILEKIYPALFPFGNLGRRCIGHNPEHPIGIIGTRYDTLVGKPGIMIERRIGLLSERYRTLSRIEPVDGVNINTSLSVEHMKIADESLRKHIANGIYGCVIIMDHHGAISAMINLMLHWSNTESPVEGVNYAISYNYDAGTFIDKLNPLFAEGPVSCEDEHDYSNPIFCINKCYDFEILGFNMPNVDSLHIAATTLSNNNSANYSYLSTPLHLLTLCNTFFNSGDMWKPYICDFEYEPRPYLENVLSDDMCQLIQDKMDTYGDTQILSGYRIDNSSGVVLNSTAYGHYDTNNIICSLFLRDPETAKNTPGHSRIRREEASEIIKDIVASL